MKRKFVGYFAYLLNAFLIVKLVIPITAHGGIINAFLAVLGRPPYALPTGGNVVDLPEEIDLTVSQVSSPLWSNRSTSHSQYLPPEYRRN
jgi:hypothetical protein